MKIKKLFSLVTFISILSGCAATQPDNTYDPYEKTNRKVFAFNMYMEETFLDPVVRGYLYIVPETFQYNINNFFKNLEEPLTFVNNILQLQFIESGKTVARFAINSTLGFAGTFEIADQIGLQRHRQRFNQTLGKWNVADGPYLAVPFIRPTNTRDFVAMGLNAILDPTILIPKSFFVETVLTGSDLFTSYARSYETVESLKKQSIDFYEASKSMYQQNSYYEINDLYKSDKKNDTSSFDVDMDDEE